MRKFTQILLYRSYSPPNKLTEHKNQLREMYKLYFCIHVSNLWNYSILKTKVFLSLPNFTHTEFYGFISNVYWNLNWTFFLLFMIEIDYKVLRLYNFIRFLCLTIDSWMNYEIQKIIVTICKNVDLSYHLIIRFFDYWWTWISFEHRI